MTKRLHAGLAARSGVLAGLLAEKGFDAKDGLEVDYGGYFSTMSEDTDLSIMTEILASTGISTITALKLMPRVAVLTLRLIVYGSL